VRKDVRVDERVKERNADEVREREREWHALTCLQKYFEEINKNI